MVDLAGIMGIPFLKKSRFTGSDGLLRFVLEKRTDEEGNDRLAAVCWHGLYSDAATPDGEKTTKLFSFDRQGLEEAQKWLNQQSGI